MPDPDRRQQLIAFFSADMANSTEFKNRHQARYSDGRLVPPRWPRYFSEVFSRVLQRFDEEMRERGKLSGFTLLSRPRLWKINGDELLFREIILPGDDGLKWLAQAVEAFLATIEAIDQEMLPDGCGLRGCVWSAGFPIRNKQIKTSSYQQSPPVIRPESTDEILPDFETGLLYNEDEGFIDYLGPDMDLGFRLAAITPPGRIVCSLDISYLLMQRPESPSIYHVGWRELKGVGGGAPYPIFWSSAGTKRPRHPWERPENISELGTFLGSAALHRHEFMLIAEEYWAQLRDFFNRPYTAPEDITPEHLRIWHLVESDPQEYETIYLQDP